jgi:ribosome-associated protein
MSHYEDDEIEYAQRPNKSQLKRESHDLEQLGIALTELPKDKLAKIPLPDKLAEAVHAARTITSFGALKRQRKFVAKLLREHEDVGPIREKLAELTEQSAQAIHRHHLIERWRDRMLAGDDSVINAFLEEHPDADRQKLRQLCRDARKEHQAEAPPRSARQLFQYLKQILEDAATGADP